MIVVSDNFVQNPKVSVVIITYNQEKYIAQAIESIVCQKTIFPFEVIIAEDCSTDSTRNVCVDYQKQYPNLIRLILHEKNLGLIDNYKSALKECKGEYIAECGGDDFWCDEYKLQKHVDYMDKHDDVVVTYHDAKSIDMSDKILSQSFLTTDCKVDFSESALKKCGWILPQTMCYCAKMKDVFIKELNKNVKNEDTFITSIMGTFGRGGYLSEISPTAYRQSPTGIWSMQNIAHKNLMKISTYAELKKYYRKSEDKEIVVFLRDRIRVLFADIQISQIENQDKKWYVNLLLKNIDIIGFRDLFHYLKMLMY